MSTPSLEDRVAALESRYAELIKIVRDRPLSGIRRGVVDNDEIEALLGLRLERGAQSGEVRPRIEGDNDDRDEGAPANMLDHCRLEFLETSVAIEKFASLLWSARCEFLDQSHTSYLLILVCFWI